MWNWDNDAKVKRDGPPLAQTDIYSVTFDTCYSSFCSHWVTHTIKIIAPLLLADTVCHTSHSLLLLVQLSKLVTTAHEQTAIERAACWKLNICQFEQGMNHVINPLNWICAVHQTSQNTNLCKTRPASRTNMLYYKSLRLYGNHSEVSKTCHGSYLEQEDSKLSVLELLPGKEPGRHSCNQNPNDGGPIRGDVGGHIGVGHSQVRKRLINKLNICEIGLTTLKTL